MARRATDNHDLHSTMPDGHPIRTYWTPGLRFAGRAMEEHVWHHRERVLDYLDRHGLRVWRTGWDGKGE